MLGVCLWLSLPCELRDRLPPLLEFTVLSLTARVSTVTRTETCPVTASPPLFIWTSPCSHSLCVHSDQDRDLSCVVFHHCRTSPCSLLALYNDEDRDLCFDCLHLCLTSPCSHSLCVHSDQDRDFSCDCLSIIVHLDFTVYTTRACIVSRTETCPVTVFYHCSSGLHRVHYPSLHVYTVTETETCPVTACPPLFIWTSPCSHSLCVHSDQDRDLSCHCLSPLSIWTSTCTLPEPVYSGKGGDLSLDCRYFIKRQSSTII